MSDPILKKAMEKRDEALREYEQWEQWIKAYVELSEPPIDSLDIPMTRRTPVPEEGATDSIDLAPVLRGPAQTTEKSNGLGLWPRGGSANR
jgi:hypothetical protein